MRAVILTMVLVAVGTNDRALADSDEPPLHVANSGVDTGNCLEPTAPCRSIEYALRRVGKNGKIRIAAGSYTLGAPENVFYLVSGAIDVRAEDGATIVGVPHEFAADLRARGLRVIADAKGIDREAAAALAGTLEGLKSNSFSTPCVSGFADIYPCERVDLLAHIADRTAAARGADIWGFVDLNTNREYAIMGYSRGTAVYDVTDAENPREVGFVDGQSTTWRDIKIYQYWNDANKRWDAYAYVTADNASDGLFIIDLTELPQRISRVNYSSDFLEAHNVYITRTDFSTGLSLSDDKPLLIVAGSNRSDGRFRIYGLDNPVSPSFIAAPATPPGQSVSDRLYMHDAASMMITDSRKDSQCVNASTAAYCDVLFDFNESTIDIWDVTDPADPVRLSQTPYTNADYTHSGWPSEDQQYLFVQDETDERDRGLATTLRAFSLSNLANPTIAGTWTGPTNAIDHNGFVRGNRYYMSNYARGLTILDISDPKAPVTAGRFDSYPSGDAVGFPGAWGTYPFLPSGNVLISDIDSGFYIVDDKTRDVMHGTLSFSAMSFAADESQPAGITVRRSGGSTGAVSVAWELISASGSADDVAIMSGTLDWMDGDGDEKTINIGLSNDGAAEGMERLMLRLVAPEGGATLSAPYITSLYISDPGDTSAVGFAGADLSVTERGFGMAVAIVQRQGSATGAISVDYAISGGDASAGSDYTGSTNGTLSWAAGDGDAKWIEIAILDDGNPESDEFLELALSNVAGGSITANDKLRIDILEAGGSNTPPNAVTGGSQTVNAGAEVTLNGSASNDPDGDSLNYAWTQNIGPAVSLSNANSATATFTAPSVSSDTLLRFQLDVTDPGGLSDSATLNVTVTSATAPRSGGGGGGLSFWLLALLLLERMRLNNRLLAVRTR
jgi:choice-of-anchor B domain-containing protein